ncbi:MAG: ATP-binding protein [Bacteroidetes bacterium]|nr:ATP-binding protein [Bacteroidota bacterium]
MDKIIIGYDNEKRAEIINERTNEIRLISAVVHELQKERDYSVLYINNPLFEIQIKMTGQNAQTDSVIRSIKLDALHSQLDTAFLAELDEIGEVRKKISWFGMSYEEVDFYYSDVIEQLIDRITAIGTSSGTEKTNDAIRGYISLIRTKESLGRMRTTLNKALDMGRFDGLDYGKFSGQKGAFESNIKSFVKLASAPLNDVFQRDFYHGNVARMLEMTDYAFEHPQDRLYTYTAEDWWISATGAMNILNDIEEMSLAEIQLIIKEDYKMAQNKINASLIMISSTILLVVLWVLLSIRSVNYQMRLLGNAADKIKNGDTDVEIEVYSDDSIGDLTKAFLSLVENTKELAVVANKIGKGNYDVPVNIRGDKDTLGNALLKMQESLKMTTVELRETVEELQQSNRYKSEFLANMSHELRTPLNSLLILSKILADNSTKNMTADQVDCANVIHKSGSGLLVLINDILDLSKIEAGRLDVEINEYSLEEIVGDVQALFKPLADQKLVKLEFVVKTPLKTIQTDKLRLEQILKNLISNAIKFTPEKGAVTVVVRDVVDDQEKMEIGLFKSAVAFDVIDTGIGIPKDKQAQVFEAFRQADGSVSRKYGGTGLGLSITKKLLALLEGEIKLKSKEGKGSVFTVFFPVDGVTTTDENNEEEYDQYEPRKKAVDSIQGSWIVEDGGAAVAQYVKELKGKNILFFTKDITHVFQLSALFDKHGLVLIDATEIEEVADKSKSEKIALYLAEDFDLTADEKQKLLQFQKVIWIGGAEQDALPIPLPEKLLMEKLKNAIANV